MTAVSPHAAHAGALPDRGARVCVEGAWRLSWSAVVDHRDGDALALTVEPGEGAPTRVTAGTEVLLSYSSRQIPCEVGAVVVDDPGRSGADRVCVRATEPPRRFQRRDAVRVPVELIVRARSADGPDDEDEPAHTFAGITENLSAGGALLRVTEAIPTGSDLVVSLQPGGDAPVMEIVAHVVRCDRDAGTARPWRLALAFRRITTAQEDHLMRFIFRLQREARGRESGIAS